MKVTSVSYKSKNKKRLNTFLGGNKYTINARCQAFRKNKLLLIRKSLPDKQLQVSRAGFAFQAVFFTKPASRGEPSTYGLG
jgi:hypothetical protein